METSNILLSEVFKLTIYNIVVKLTVVNDIAKYANSVKYGKESEFFRLSGVVVDCTHREDLDYDFDLIFDPEEYLREDIVVHEVFHLTTRIMEFIGASFNEGSQESYAYLIQYLYKRIRCKLIKLKQEVNGYSDTSKEV